MPGCAYKVLNLVIVLHSLGSGPLRLLSGWPRHPRYLQMGRACKSEGGRHAPHDAGQADTQPLPTQLCLTKDVMCIVEPNFQGRGWLHWVGRSTLAVSSLLPSPLPRSSPCPPLPVSRGGLREPHPTCLVVQHRRTDRGFGGVLPR
jgi:hypothetical protein